MASPDVLDFERLLHPIAGDQPTGVDLRLGSSPKSSRQALRAAWEASRQREKDAIDYKLRSAEEKEDGKIPAPETPKWHDVESLATELLADQSKDVWVGARLIEGLTRTNGFAGLRDGFRLIRLLSETYWDSLYPRPEEYSDDDEGIRHAVSELSSLNDTLIAPILQISLIPATDSFRAFSSADYEDASELDTNTRRSPQERSRKIEQGCPTMEALTRSVPKVPVAALANVLEDIDQALSEFTQLSQTLDDKCGTKSPLGSTIKNTLVECQDRVRYLTRDVLGGNETEANEAPAADETSALTGPAKGAPLSGDVRTRGEAFQYLLKISDFFRRTEPHSPVSYAIEQAIRWGKMTLPELMSDLIADDSARREMFRRAGIQEAKSSENS